MKNLRSYLDDVAAAIRREGASWQSGETSMTALSDEEIQRRLGFVPPPGAPSLEEVDRALRARRPEAPFIAAASIGLPRATTCATWADRAMSRRSATREDADHASPSASSRPWSRPSGSRPAIRCWT